MSASAQFVHTRGTSIIGTDGEPVRLQGICIGGWLNMENFITGFAANESMMRSGVLDVLGQDRYTAVLREPSFKLLRRRRRCFPCLYGGQLASVSP